MRLAIVAGGFSPDEADRLRRAMGAWRRRGGLSAFQRKLLAGMRARGYEDTFALAIYRQIEGFGEYGFPESHAASFALLVYVSAWLKCHEPAAFFCALLNSLPMGFYGPSQLLRCARESGVELRPVDVTVSDWDCTLERTACGEPALRLGLCRVKSLARAAAERLVAARRMHPFAGVQDLAARAALTKGDLGALAFADALRPLAGHRHRARWAAAGVEPPRPLLPLEEESAAEPLLAPPSEGQDIVADYAATSASLRRHPLALLRARLCESGAIAAAELLERADGSTVHTAGLVINRQRPGSARGTIFVTLEDETGWVQVVVHAGLAERQRRELIGSRLLAVFGRLQRRGEVIHLLAGRLLDRSAWLGGLHVRSRDFR